MNLVKWFRKNNTKLMAVVVIVLMIGFIGGSSLTYILRGRSDTNKTMAYYGNKIAIKGYDLLLAQQELDILQLLQAGKILQALQTPDRTPDLHSLALGELLFAEQRPTSLVISYIQQAVEKNQYKIGNKQINDLYTRNAPNFYYWFILNKEAENAGFKVQNESARALLAQAIPNLTPYSYSQYIGNIMKNNVISEARILSVFSKLLALLKYSHAACSGQNVTINQLKYIAASRMEGLNIEFVRFDSEKFINNQESPTEQQIAAHFEKYKENSPDEITDSNPYGFGYKLPDRVQIEYMAVKLDDIKKIIQKPSDDELMEFYNNNKDRAFTEKVLTDPNDPGSSVNRTKKFAEVADTISEYLVQEKINNKASVIIQEARILADGSLQDINDAELGELSIDQRKAKASDYASVAEKLKSKYKIDIYDGVTGELSAADMQTGKLLSKLYIEGYVNELRLARLVFAVEPLSYGDMGDYETIKPKIYLSLGPVKDEAGKIIAIVRVVKAIQASAPESINQQYSTKTLGIDPNQSNTEKDKFSVKEKVTKDFKRLAAMDTAKNKAAEFLEMASQEGQVWENVVEKFNELYGLGKTGDSNDPNLSRAELTKDANETPFELKKLSSLRRLSSENLYTLAIQNKGNPASEVINNMYKKEALFLDKFFSMLPQDSNSAEFKPEIVEFKPDLSYYAVKNISINRLWKENYERIKAMSSYQEEHFESQGLALIQFNPENIFKRMNFRFPEEAEKSKNAEPDE